MGPAQLMLCLMSAVFVESSTLLFRHFNDKQMDRTSAHDYCYNLNMTLVTLYDEDDARSVAKFDTTGMGIIWVGLKNISNEETDYPMCPSTSEKMNCSTELYFRCEIGSVVDVELNWCAAKQYCQYRSLGDLGNSTNCTNSQTKGPLWIGGNISDNWAWDDDSCSTYRKWQQNPTNTDTISISGNGLKALGGNLPVVCSKGDVRIVVVKKSATWEGALDHCEKHHSGLLQIYTEEHQESVKQWFNRTTHKDKFWVGLRQSRLFGFWIWEDRVVDSAYWKNGTPEMPLSHQCGVINVTDCMWEDHNCLFTLPFLCQERIVKLGKK